MCGHGRRLLRLHDPSADSALPVDDRFTVGVSRGEACLAPLSSARDSCPAFALAAAVPGWGYGESSAGKASGMPWPLAWGQVAVLEVDAGAAPVGGEPDLDGAGPGWQVAGARVAPADEQPARRVQFQEAAADWRPFDIENKLAAGLGVEQGVLAHPRHDCLRPGEALIHLLGRGRRCAPRR